MKIEESKKLQVLVEKQLDLQMRKYLVKVVTTHVHTGNQYGILQGMRLAAELGAKGPHLLTAFHNNDLYFFDLTSRNEDDWCRVVENLQQEIPKNPRKVLVKMLASRFLKVYHGIDSINRRAKQEAGAKNYYASLTLAQIGQISSLADWQIAKDSIFSEDLSKNYYARRPRDELHKEVLRKIDAVLARPDIDESIVCDAGKEAWGLYIAGQVMES